MENPLAILQHLQKTGILPLLLGKAGIKPPGGASPQGAPQTPPTTPSSITQSGGSTGQPGVGGAPPQGGSAPGGPQVKFDPFGAGASMPPPIAQPHEAVQSIAQLLMGWNDRKKKGEEAEAANIAQNLIQAMRSGDKDTVNDILNNDHSKKILNKVYKGWLTKMQEAQKPGKEPDPTVSGFEAGIQKATQPPQGQPPGSTGGYRMPQPSQADQLGAAKTSAELQAAQQDPNRLLSSQLTSGERRETELGAGPEKVAAEKARAEAVVKKAASDLQKAQLEVQKAEADLKIKQTEAQTAETKGKITTDIEGKKLLIAATNLDIARERLKLSITKTKAGTNVTFATKLKMAAIDKAIGIVTKVQNDKRSFSASDFTDLASELRAAGATELIKRLPQGWLSAHLMYGKNDVTDVLEALQHYKEDYQSVIDGLKTPDKKEAKTEGKPGAVPEGDDESEDVNADIIINPEDMEKP